MKLTVLAAILWAVCAQPTLVEGVGTTMSVLTPNSPYRVFNDLMKQSSVFVPYDLDTTKWVPNRKWGFNLTMGNNLYPSTLPNKVYAGADILLFQGIDENLIGQVYEVSFLGTGKIGVFQNNTATFSNVTVATG